MVMEGKIDISPTKIYVGKADVRAGKEHPENIGKIKNVPVAENAATTLNESYGGIRNAEKRTETINEFLQLSKRVGRGVDPFHAIAARDVHHEALSKRDWLTGFLNEEAFLAQLEETFKNSASVGVGAADLDKFSWLNDTLGGHEMGNLYLQLIARRIRSVIAQTDIFARRGDEFLFIINSNIRSEDDFVRVVQRIHHALEGKKVLRDTLIILRESDEEVRLKGGKKEFCRTLAFKPIAQKVLDIYDDVVVDEKRGIHAKKSFMDNMRGSGESKQQFIDNIEAIDPRIIARMRDYLADTRLSNELGASAHNRFRFEEEFSALVFNLIPEMGISIAGTYLDNPAKFDSNDIQRRLDQSVYKVKHKGGNRVFIMTP